MSATKKASLMEVKKFFYPTESAKDFNDSWKQVPDKDKAELQDLLGTAIETGSVTLA